MTKKDFLRNYNGDAIQDGQVMVPFEYMETEANNYTNAECIKSFEVGGKNYKVVYKAVDEEWAKDANSALNLHQNEVLGHYAVPNSVSRDEMEDQYELALGEAPSAEDRLLQAEELSETQQAVVRTAQRLMERSPKHGLAFLLMGLGIKGDQFAQEMKMSKPGANYVRDQIKGLAPNRIDSFTQIDIEGLKASKSANADYYREAATRYLKILVDLYFEA